VRAVACPALVVLELLSGSRTGGLVTFIKNLSVGCAQATTKKGDTQFDGFSDEDQNRFFCFLRGFLFQQPYI
jgi:hypothetical protein